MAATGRRPGDGDGHEPEPKRHRSVAFAEDENYKATPVTAKHNLRNSGQDEFKCPWGIGKRVQCEVHIQLEVVFQFFLV